MRRHWRREEVQESQGPRIPRSRGPTVSGSQGPRYLKLNSNTSLTLKKVHLVFCKNAKEILSLGSWVTKIKTDTAGASFQNSWCNQPPFTHRVKLVILSSMKPQLFDIPSNVFCVKCQIDAKNCFTIPGKVSYIEVLMLSII